MKPIRSWNRIGVTALHISSALVPLGSGILLRSSPALACVGIALGGTLMAALVARAMRVDDENELLMTALDAPTDESEAITLPQIPVAEPVTGVKHRIVDSSETPKIVTWHGQRGRS